MRRAFPVELVYQVFSLLIAFILVHALYVSVIRPQAKVFLEHEAVRMQADAEYVQQRSFFVVVKDYEQEACFVLMLWAFAISASRAGVRISSRSCSTRTCCDCRQSCRSDRRIRVTWSGAFSRCPHPCSLICCRVPC